MRGEEVQIESPFLITTNLESRSERAGDREDLIVFEVPTASPAEMTEAEKRVIFNPALNEVILLIFISV